MNRQMEKDFRSLIRQYGAISARSLWLLGAGALILAAFLLWALEAGTTQEDASLETASAVRGDIEKSVTSVGSVQPRNYVDVGTQVSGQLQKLHVEIGDAVAVGDPLAEIDPRVYESRVQANRARLISLKAQISEQEAQFKLAGLQNERNKQLYASRAVSQNEFQQSTAAVRVSEAKIASLKAQIEEVQSTLAGDVANLGYTKIFAPIAGTVVDQIAKKGQTLNASQTAPIIVRIANLETMTIEAQVAEADVVRVDVGMPVYFTTLGMPERRWQARVRQILPTPQIVNDVVLYRVLMDVENSDRSLMTSMSTQVFFVLERAENVLTVPVAALKPGKAGAYRVDLMTRAGLESRRVKVGVMNRSSAEIREGLVEGDRVILGVRAEGKASSGSARRGGDGGGRRDASTMRLGVGGHP